jgi:hypothetical protein
MGAESSALQGVHALGATLDDIERRLRNVENFEIQNENTIALSDSVFISGKVIGCRANVDVIVGPVIGIIGQTFARILLETNVDSDVTLNVFIMSDPVTEARFYAQKVTFIS